MKRKRLLILFNLMVLLTLCAWGSAAFSENLLENGDFSVLDEEGLPEGWFPDAYILEQGYTVFSASEADEEHGMVAEINNIAANDARFAQTVEVKPNTLYCLSGDIMTEGVSGGHGANLSVEGVYAFSEKLYNTDGKWEHVDYYGETGPDQDYIIVFARLGGYSGESSGKAWFDQMSLREVDSVPGDGIADLWYKEEDYEDLSDDTDEEEDEAAAPAWPFLLLISLVYAAAACAAIRFFHQDETPHVLSGKPKKVFTAPVILILLAGLALRLVLSWFTEGYMVDVNCFLSWGRTMAIHGPSGFYEATNFCDYPPLYTYVLGLNTILCDWLHCGEAATRLVFRLIPCLSDLAACLLVYSLMVREHRCKEKAAECFLLFLVLNPAMILNSAAWGQMDSFLCLLLLAVALLAMKDQWTAALPVYVVSVLVKPQALMLGPLGLIYIVMMYARKPEVRKQILMGTGLGILVLFLGVVPFTGGQNWDWIIQLYSRTLASYPYATVNTANFYYLLGGNWQSVTKTAYLSAPILLSVFSLGYGLLWMVKSKSLPYRWIEAGGCALFAAAFVILACIGASWTYVGIAAMALAFMISISIAVRSGDIRFLPYLGGLLFILLYVFGIKMHERYLFPAIFFLALAYPCFRDRRILYVLCLFTVTLFLNEGIVLDNSIRLGSAMGHLNQDTTVLAGGLSILNMLGSFYAVHLGIALLIGEDAPPMRKLRTVLPLPGQNRSGRAPYAMDPSLHWSAKDSWILLSITILYSAVSLLTLGSTKAPQTSWTSSSGEEQVVFDLGSDQKDFSILYFGQVSRNPFTVSVSPDGETWGEETWAQMDQGQCWKWKYVTESYENGAGERTFLGSDLSYVCHFSGRYVRLSAQTLGLCLNEVLFRDENGNALSATIHSRTGGNSESELYSDPGHLLDEQDTLEKLPALFEPQDESTLPAQPSWWNSTYFDEIYHARTAYEFIQGTVPYETSHPPLGKVIMSWFVGLFGMTPFGWRFAGALAGILMLPGMYLLGKQLTKRTRIATIACLLIALDCLHLTQTQIATIDSFPVLFILFSYLFMLRFLQTDPYSARLRQILPALAGSGLFMGLAIASKWIGIYAGAGLAILFFWHCLRMSSGQKTGMGRRFLIICLWCILFFIVIPIVLYLVSYIPYFAYNSRRIRSLSDYIGEVWRAQVGMLNYHSTKNLGMDHPFYSPWWEWPVIGKPMYYAAEQYIPDSAVIHHSIFCFGNPVIWFSGLGALLICFFRAVFARRYSLEGSERIWHLSSGSRDPRYMFLFIGILAQYLPWVLVPRGTYIYHYFASLPFLMLSIALCFDQHTDSRRAKAAWRIGVVFILISAAGFILLFPYASGIGSPASWLDIGRKILRIWY